MSALKCEKEYKYTQNEIRFCDAIIYKKMSQYEAYHYAKYKTENVKRETIDANASRLSSKPKIVARISELSTRLEEKKLDKAIWSFEDSVRELKDALEKSKELTDYKTVINAVDKLNSMHGYNKQNIDINAELTGDFEIKIQEE